MTSCQRWEKNTPYLGFFYLYGEFPSTTQKNFPMVIHVRFLIRCFLTSSFLSVMRLISSNWGQCCHPHSQPQLPRTLESLCPFKSLQLCFTPLLSQWFWNQPWDQRPIFLGPPMTHGGCLYIHPYMFVLHLSLWNQAWSNGFTSARRTF